MLKKYKEVILYIIFGIGTTLVNWLVYVLCLNLFLWGITLSNGVAWFFAIIFAFITNKLFVFKSLSFNHKTFLREAASFIAARALSGVLEIVGPTFLMGLGITGSFWGIKGFWAKLIINIFVIVMNYLLSKLVIFKRESGRNN